MIDYTTGNLITFKEPKKIVLWEIWFATPMGLVKHIEDACKACEKNDLDPNLCVKAVAVANCEDGTYEAIL